ncbi:MAG: alpha/beta fold hydrolase [Solirubrobacteraceae bacterium]
MDLNHHRAGAGDPLLLVHGIGSRWQMWEPVLDRLAARHEVIAVDLPGFGASPMPPPGTPPGVDSLIGLLEGFLDGLGVRMPHVAGNSLGGLIALEMAARGLVRSATALSPAGFATPAETALTRTELWLSVRAARRIAGHADRIMAPVAGRRLGLNLFVADPSRLSAGEAAASVRALAGAPWFDATLPSLKPMAFGEGEQIAVPVTVAWGNRDRVLFPRQARRAARAIPRARVLMLHGCGHVPTYDDPEQVARVLLETSAA